MKNKKVILGFLATVLFSSLSQAYFVALYKNSTALNTAKQTRVLVSGRGTDLSILPQRAAMGRAALYNQNFREDQVLLISVFEGDSKAKQMSNREHLIKSGFNILKENDEILNTKSTLSELVKLTQIRSLEFFGHNSPSLGSQTDGLGARFDFRMPEIDILKDHFTSDAYVLIHGCNSGWIIAGDMSHRWNVPVSGSYTQTRFERLHSDGHYYLYETGKFPNSNWAETNPELNQIPCAQGGCLRQRSAFSRYIGKWGEFEGPTLSHVKFLCQLDEKDCHKRMALSLYGFLSEKPLTPNANFESFKQTAKEYLCPVYVDRKKVDECLKALKAVDEGRGVLTVHFVVNQPQLSCTLKECKAKMVCGDHTCVLKEISSKNSQTLVQEYLAFMDGYQLLKKEGRLP